MCLQQKSGPLSQSSTKQHGVGVLDVTCFSERMISPHPLHSHYCTRYRANCVLYPQAWKGLIDCLERTGAGRLDALPECLLRAAEIAEGKGNFSRARTLRVRLGTVLDRLGKQEEALEAVRYGR